MYKLLSSYTVISDAYTSFIRNKTTSTLLGLVPHWAQAPGIHPLLGIQLTQLRPGAAPPYDDFWQHFRFWDEGRFESIKL